MDNATVSQDPVVICLQQDVDIEWTFPVITDSQQLLDHEVFALIPEDVPSQALAGAGQIPTVNCLEVLPDFLGSALNYQIDDSGQVFYVTYAVPGAVEAEQQNETPGANEKETVTGEVKPPHPILHVAEDGTTVFLNVPHTACEETPAINGTDQADTTNASTIDKHAPSKKSGKKHFPPKKVQNSFVGGYLCIEEKLQIVDAMLTPAPKRTGKKKDKEETEKAVKEIGLSYLCMFCSAAFPEEKDLHNHLDMHKEEQKGKCDVSAEQHESAGAETQKQLENGSHIVLKRYVCPQCPAAFSRLSHLSSHQQHAHLGDRPHKCQICKKSFYKRCDLRSHLNTHLGISKSICEVCGRKFNHVSNLIRHSRIHTGIKPYPCSVCGKRFSQLNGMHQHKTIHKDNRDIICSLCPKTFKSYSSLRRHMRYSHEDKLSSMGKEANTALKMKGNSQIRRFYCKLCGESFKFVALLKHHESLHIKANKFHCKFCKNKFFTAEGMKTHNCDLNSDRNTSPNKKAQPQSSRKVVMYIAREHTTSGKQQQHLQPEEQTTQSELLRTVGLVRRSTENFPELEEGTSSVKVNNLSNEKSIDKSAKLRENINDILTADKSGLPSDIKDKIRIRLKNKNKKRKKKKKKIKLSEHSPLKSTMRKGPKDSIDISDLTEVVYVVDKNGEKVKKKVYKCPECSKQFNKNSNFKQHLGVHYMDLMKHSCPTCGQSFAWKSTLNKHIMRLHSETPPPKSSCEYCGREYPLAVQVQEHIKRDHLKQRPHVCPTCNKRFYKKHDLNVHQRTHTQERPYICGTCSKSFSHLSHIIRHERIHNGVRPYKCSDCDREFIQSTSLKIHRQLHCKTAKKTDLDGSHTDQETKSEPKEDN